MDSYLFIGLEIVNSQSNNINGKDDFYTFVLSTLLLAWERETAMTSRNWYACINAPRLLFLLDVASRLPW
jgi:hypothetical protein